MGGDVSSIDLVEDGLQDVVRPICVVAILHHGNLVLTLECAIRQEQRSQEATVFVVKVVLRRVRSCRCDPGTIGASPKAINRIVNGAPSNDKRYDDDRHGKDVYPSLWVPFCDDLDAPEQCVKLAAIPLASLCVLAHRLCTLSLTKSVTGIFQSTDKCVIACN